MDRQTKGYTANLELLYRSLVDGQRMSPTAAGGKVEQVHRHIVAQKMVNEYARNKKPWN